MTYLGGQTNTLEPFPLAPKDWRDTPILVGSLVLYSTRSGSSLHVIEAKVLEIIPREPEWHEQNHFDKDPESQWSRHFKKFLFKLKVQPLREVGIHFAEDRSTGSPVMLHVVDRVTVVG